MGRPGRPPKSLKALQAQFCVLLTEGLHRPHAAAQVGLTEAQISEWYANGARDSKGIYFEFHRDVNKAESTYAKTLLDMMKNAGAKDPKVLQWALSRRFPELYGRKDNVEAERPEDKAAQQQATKTLLIERLERLFPETPPAPPAPTEGPTLEVIPGGKPDAVG